MDGKLMVHVAGEHERMSLIHIVLGAAPLPAKDVRAAFHRYQP